jgi:hypothetical protein
MSPAKGLKVKPQTSLKLKPIKSLPKSSLFKMGPITSDEPCSLGITA